MAAPTAKVRAAVYQRDVNRCVRCGREDFLSFQHRTAVGMGGSKLPPTPMEGLTACSPCNARFEGDLQTVALLNGWKVPRWLHQLDRADEVPVYYAPERIWCVLIFESRMWVSEDTALASMREIYGAQYDEWRSAA
ncbi:HNH endonuclease [Pseudoclavibacter sp. RFBB5]|uniref:HNH endonuclease n=1 Tax=Pseudoclavibacter sp. RFBB5 TaxID=2080574 RepID=UPI000CE72B8D|nr:hypothetical protein [Pseudoclavibacter sp. RFBB5]PPG29667.1 hypothetical protein C5B97_11905 [Pseudoclavibacter sp. RFBB5]